MRLSGFNSIVNLLLALFLICCLSYNPVNSQVPTNDEIKAAILKNDTFKQGIVKEVLTKEMPYLLKCNKHYKNTGFPSRVCIPKPLLAKVVLIAGGGILGIIWLSILVSIISMIMCCHTRTKPTSEEVAPLKKTEKGQSAINLR